MKEFFLPLLESPMFGIVLSVLAFHLGTLLNQKLRSPLVNPLLTAIAVIVIVLSVLDIPLASYQRGGTIISMFLAPATAVLGVSIYRQRAILRERFLPVVLGCLAGSVTSMVSAYGLCWAFGLEPSITASMIPKSVTTAIAIEISAQAGGIIPITVVAVILTGILGAVFAPLLIKLFRVEDPVVAGVAIGTSSHAIGTSKAIELGEIQGAMSGVAIGVSGILTVILSLLL